ncbi:DUF6477 family protein [Marivita hallyeonensis]|uniref:Uncharacterized protein n=1 Tax=Marivita hallyeonensis TaxID=996342 RepID=A0A1M5R6B7_9RHOB|nr:DUF6477 family protein [Marivita hallyeonensis]SHH21731.1 hypothetical protein SAMN05443551_1633 [Marivita hallyeonensis]
MQDLLTQITTLRRPRLLIRAARIGAQDYRRDARLPRLLGYGVLPRTGAALVKLMAMEAEMNEQRKTGDACYGIARHVDVLTAIMGETQLLQAQVDAKIERPGFT